MADQGRILVEVAPGELIDKITILEIKSQRMTDAVMLANVAHEHQLLQEACQQAVPQSEEILLAKEQLKAINEKLWEIEDEIRVCERDRDFGDRFIQLARAVYCTNDERARVKREINALLGSQIVEEKHYVDYRDGDDRDGR